MTTDDPQPHVLQLITETIDGRAGDRGATASGTERPARQGTGMGHPSEIEVVAGRDAAAYGFTVRAQANGLLHRITPMRDPQQPRFWCVVVFRCSSAGVPDAAERPWIGPGGLRRDELKATLEAIRANPSAWLAEATHHALRAWMLDPQATPPVQTSSAAKPGRPRATTTR